VTLLQQVRESTPLRPQDRVGPLLGRRLARRRRHPRRLALLLAASRVALPETPCDSRRRRPASVVLLLLALAVAPPTSSSQKLPASPSRTTSCSNRRAPRRSRFALRRCPRVALLLAAGGGPKGRSVSAPTRRSRVRVGYGFDFRGTESRVWMLHCFVVSNYCLFHIVST
jgi:hypothetical protein